MASKGNALPSAMASKVSAAPSAISSKDSATPPKAIPVQPEAPATAPPPTTAQPPANAPPVPPPPPPAGYMPPKPPENKFLPGDVANRATTEGALNLTVAAKFEFQNPDLNWLTFESIYNGPLWRHTDAIREMGIYNMLINKVRIIVASYILEDAQKLSQLKSIFFPSDFLWTEDFKSLLYIPWTATSDHYDQEWKDQAQRVWKKLQDEAAKRGSAVPRARFPYNVVNNDASSTCLGTYYEGSEGGVDALTKDIVLESQSWPMWQTASRSCVVIPSPPTKTIKTWYQSTTEDRRWKYVDAEKNIIPDSAREPDARAFKLGTAKQRYYSVKTGVQRVGKKPEGANKVGNLGGKNTLEPDAIVAALRTEHMLAMDAHYALRAVKAALTAKTNLLILPEALTVTCIESQVAKPDVPVNSEWLPMSHDGFQLRDLDGFDKKLTYFPALSTSYVKGIGDLATFIHVSELEEDEFTAWNTYWREHYACRIGKIQAQLHLLYGFAPLTPNQQNFVFEIDSKAVNPSERIKRTVLRDVLDYRLHTGWIRLMLDDAYSALKTEDKRTELLNTTLRKPLTFNNKPPCIEIVQNLLRFEASTTSPVSPPGLSPTLKMLGTSETGVCSLFDPTPTGSKFDPKNLKPGEVLDNTTGPNEGAKIGYYSGLQLKFFAYTSPCKGATDNSIANDSRFKSTWQRTYFAMLDWGLAHADAFVRTCNEFLKNDSGPIVELKYGGQPINKTFLEELKVKRGTDTTLKPDERVSEEFARTMGGAISSKDDDGVFSLKSIKAQLGTVEPGGAFKPGKLQPGDLEDRDKKMQTWELCVSAIIEKAIYQDPAVRQRLRGILRPDLK